MEKIRLTYPDICKFVAIFIVTWSHCAQCISGVIWTNFWGGTQIDIAFNMPLFMLMNGWFINPTKMRSVNMGRFVADKFSRLIIPAVTWYFICCLLTFNRPRIGGVVSLYWFLTALFVCLCIIYITIRLIKNICLCAILSSIIVICCPHSDFVNINFMFPFIWAGFFLRKQIDNKNMIFFIVICIIIGIILSIYWNPDRTVYRCPFRIISVNVNMIITYIYRFVIGFSFSAAIIYFIKRVEKTRGMIVLSQCGQFSLVIYTASLAFIGLISRLFDFFNYHTNQFVVLDCLSFLLCVMIVIITILLSAQFRKNKYARLFLLGE